MKFPESWLREHVAVDASSAELAARLTAIGLEVEESTPIGGKLEGVVVAHILSAERHPDAERLQVCQVDTGSGTVQIVCGAPNARPGLKAPLATVGAKLPGGIDIKAAKLRGVESFGMLCSAKELGIDADASGLLELPADAPVGAPLSGYLGLPDTALELKLTPNRADCFSVRGIAFDVAAAMGANVNAIEIPEAKIASKSAFEVKLEAGSDCPRFCGRVIEGLDAAARTPLWMAERLRRAGLRPISPLVDITNYVMLERGQPMHAFDDAKLRGAVGVRFMQPGEKIKLLNEQEVEYRPNLLAITDDRGPVALAGVMGGWDTMVDDGTTDVFFESAWFAPEIIQGKARDLALASDAAYRFERGVDPAGSGNALELATRLTLEICGGQAGPLCVARGDLPGRAPVMVAPPRVRALLGYDVADEEMHEILRRLSCLPENEGNAIKATPPSWRFDLNIEEDFVEEVARVHGYEHVPANPPRSSLPMLGTPEGDRGRFDLRRAAAALGYQEVVNYSFVAEDWEADFAANTKPVRLANPIASHMSVMRTTLIGGLVQTLRANLNRGEARVRVFEVGRTFDAASPSLTVQPEKIAGLAYGSRWPEQWGEKGSPVDFYDAKGDVEVLAGARALEFQQGSHAACHPGRCATVRLGGEVIGIVGELHPALQQKYELPSAPVVFELATAPLLAGQAPRFQGVSRMPVVRRDTAFSIDEKVPVGDILRALRARVPGFVREIEVFDQYRGKGVEPGRKSLALRIVMQDTDRTLTDSDVEAVVAFVRETLSEQFQATPRT